LDKYVTISIPTALAEAIDKLNKELGYWPSRGAFVREAVLEKLRAERQRLSELRKAKPNDENTAD
jgi:Arc/MetJ-type ribon-helix-helix transcriptional regulator